MTRAESARSPGITERLLETPFAEGIRKYQNFDYAGCVATFEILLSNYPETTPGYVDALVYAGAASFYCGDKENAAGFFRRAKEIDPAYKIDNQTLSPEVAGEFSLL